MNWQAHTPSQSKVRPGPDHSPVIAATITGLSARPHGHGRLDPGSHEVTFAESNPETSKARIGREKPDNDSSPTSWLTTRSSAAAFTRWVTRICQGAASAQRRAARLVTLPMEAYSKRPEKPIRPSVA